MAVVEPAAPEPGAREGASGDPPPHRSDDVAKWRRLWQRRMAPVMVGMILALTLFFTGVSLLSFNRVEQPLLHPEQRKIDYPAAPTGSSADALTRFYRQKAAVLLEQEIMERRYDSAQASVAARTWVRFMGFVTGMTLAMVGAAFVLGQLSDPGSSLKGGGNGFTIAFVSSSPGLVLALLGVVLMSTTIILNPKVSTQDSATYFSTISGNDASQSNETPVVSDAANAAIAADSNQECGK